MMPSSPETIAAALRAVQRRIETALQDARREAGSVQLLAVSKTFQPEAIVAAAQSGQVAFGENYIQEAVYKIVSLRALAGAGAIQTIEWHCIGPVQSNKTRLVAEYFDWLHTLDRLKIAQRLNEQRPSHLAPLQVCIQVNIDNSPTKSGLTPDTALALAHAVIELPRLQLRGIMCMPDPSTDPSLSRQHYRLAKQLFDNMKMELAALAPDFDTLSMGMSGDLESAIAEGSTLVRVGSAIFGTRPAQAENQT